MTSDMVKVTPFGGCLIHNPLAEYYRRQKTFGLYSKQNGWNTRPFSLSASTNVQLVDFMTRKINVPKWIQTYIYFEAVGTPTKQQSQKFMAGDIALVEMSTPTVYFFDDFLLNVNRFEVFIQTVQAELESERKLIGQWQRALKSGNEAIRKPLAERLHKLLPQDTLERKQMARFIIETTTKLLDVDEMTQITAELRDRMGIPVALVLHNFSFMPDGRSISWPADFKSNTIEVARRLNMPTLDLAPFVQAEGVDKVMSYDRRHYEDKYMVPVGEIMSDFCTTALNAGIPIRSAARAAVLLDHSAPPIEAAVAVNSVSDLAYEAMAKSPTDILGIEFRARAAAERQRFNEVLGRARLVDRQTEPRLYIEAWRNVLEVNPNHLQSIRRVIGAASFLKDYSELTDAVLAHLEVTPGDAELAEKLARAALRCGKQVSSLDYLARHGLIDISVNSIFKLQKHVVKICRDAITASDTDEAIASFDALELADAKHPAVVSLREEIVAMKAGRANAAHRVTEDRPIGTRPLSASRQSDSDVVVMEQPARHTAAQPPQYEFDRKTGGHIPAERSVVYTIVVLGGAWANGVNGGSQDRAVSLEAEHPGKALMFDAGMNPFGRDANQFADLREDAAASAMETPCAGLADQILRNCEIRFGRKPKLLCFSVARESTSLSGRGLTEEDGFLRGSVQHREVMRLLARACALAASRNERLEVPAICLLHGEHEAGEKLPGSTYRRALSSLQLQYDTDIRALTGQNEPVRLYLTQTNLIAPRSDPEIALAQLNAKFNNPYIQCVGPTYFTHPGASGQGSGTDPTSVGYRRIGQMFGRFVLDDLWGVARDPLRVEEAFWVGEKTIRVRYNRAVVVEDTDRLVNVSDLGPGRGFDFSDGTQRAPGIEGVAEIWERPSEIDIELTAPSSGFRKRLLIAARPTGEGGAGRLQGARSGIRSRDSFDTDPLDGAELYDWACTEVVAIP